MEKVNFNIEYSFKEIEPTQNPCKHCAFAVGNFGCLSRIKCPYSSQNPVVYKFQGIKEEIVQSVEEQQI